MCKTQNYFGVFVLVALALGTQARADWATYQRDPSHSGYVPGAYRPTGAALKWSSPVGTGELTDLAVGGGKVFVSQSYRFSNQPSFFAVDAASGSLAWSKSFGSINSTNAPAYANGIVYLQTGNHASDTWLHAFNVNTGNYVFKSPFAAQWESYLSPTVYDNHVYIDGGYYGGMYSFNATSGNQDWFGSVPQYDWWTPAVDNNYAYAFTGSGSTSPVTGKLTILNRLTGTTKTIVTDPGYDWNGYSMRSSVTLGSMNDAYAINGGRLLAFDTANPGIKWVKSGGYFGQPSIANGVIYINRNGGITALSESTGDQLWTWFLSNGSLSSNVPLVVTDNVLFAGTSTTTYAIDLTTHQDIWSYPMSGRLALDNGVLYIAGNNGTLAAINVVPEPASLAWIAAATAIFCRRRRVCLK